MKRKKFVGLCIAYKKNHNNYGTSLLGFATTKVISDLGYDYEIINYKKKRNLPEMLLKAPFMMISGGYKTLKNKMGFKRDLKKFPHYAKGIEERTIAVNRYKEENFESRMRTYEGYEELSQGSLNYDIVLVGSDQVWLPLGLYTGFFNLLFVDDSVPKVSYSSSFGVSKIPIWQRKQTRDYLERIDAIGVREIRGKEIVETLTNKHAKVVLDPTLLLSNEDWEKEIEKSSLDIKEEYILCYYLGTNPESREAANELSKKTGLKIVFMPHMDEYVSADESFGDYKPYGVSPIDFAKLIKNATYVCTDSFHCTVFAIHFERQFITFYRFDPKSKNSRNSRIDSLFGLLNLQSRLFNWNIFECMTSPIDYTSVNRRVEELREESLNFLKTSLNLAK